MCRETETEGWGRESEVGFNRSLFWLCGCFFLVAESTAWRGRGEGLKELRTLVGVDEELRSSGVAEFEKEGGEEGWRRRRACIGINSSNGELLS